MLKPTASAPPIDRPEPLSPGPVIKEDNFLDPVPPFSSGEGFPFAPADWPNPGDSWGWRVGRRISASGYYTDRSLIPPRNLQKPNCPRCFSSRRSLEDYILKEFPNADIDTFFATFIWRVPSTLCCSETAEASSHSQNKVSEVGKEEIPRAVKWKRKHTAASSSAKQQTRQSFRQSVRVTKATDSKIDFCSVNDEAETPSKDMRRYTSDCEYDQPNSDCIAGNHSLVKCMPENFDSYIDSLDDIIQGPLSEALSAYAGTIHSSTQDDELAEAPIMEEEKAKIISLKKDYYEKKQKVALLQTALDSNLLAIKEIEDQIAKLNSQRVELMETVATKKMTMADLTNDQQKVAHAIQKIVHQIQVANSKKTEWDMKKKNAETCEAEIFARFGPLK